MSLEQIEKIKSDLVLAPLNNKEELRNWMTTYLDIKFPMGTVYPTSTHGPIDAMWRIYELMKTGENQDIPQVTMLSSRDSYKTLGAAALEVLCMIHFKISIAHMAAIKSQSDKAIEYANSFFRKLGPYLVAKGWKQISDNKSKMEWLTETGQNLYLRVIIATVAGANCIDGEMILHTNLGDIKAKELYLKIQNNEKILTKSMNQLNSEIEYKPIVRGFKEKKHKKIYQIIFENDIFIKCSPDHEIFVIGKGFEKAENLKTEDECIYKDNTKLKVSCIDTVNFKNFTDTYDFEIEDNHNYFTNGILTHNSEHCPMLFIDEVDVIQDPRALKEAKMIPSMSPNGKFPLTVYLSTRKFAGGLMEKTLKETLEAGGEVLRWNIIDICERITPEEARVDEPKVVRYITTQLPMENLSQEQWEALAEDKRIKYEKFEAYAGIADYSMLPVMRNYLVDRPQEDTGNLYKPFAAVRNNFKQIGDPDWAEAQLLCNKPSSSGLVYPRFDAEFNVLSVEDALERILGEKPEHSSFKYLEQYIVDLGITVIGGGDWGYTDYTFLPVLAVLPNGEIWLMTNHLANKMELDDIVEVAVELNDRWRVNKWYVDQNYPAYIKTLKKKGLRIPAFNKVVEDGIAALQGKIVDSENRRKFFIIDVPENKPVIDAFGEYRWKTDGKGETIEGKPHHDKDGISDIMDGLRYPFQNLFSKGMKPIVTSSGDFSQKKIKVPKTGSMAEVASSVNQQIMQHKIGELSKNGTNKDEKDGKGKKKKILHF